MITKYGYSTVGTIAFILFLINIIAFAFSNPLVRCTIIAISVIFFLFTLNFFRDPARITPSEEGLVIAPADGKIISITKVNENEYFQEKAKKISIFMSPLNVHVNRIPISGKVDYLKYHPGKYLVAFEEKSSENNERMSIGIASKFGKVKLTQIAGFIARRIVCDLSVNQVVQAGEKFGMIKFGSRVDIFLPINAKVKVKLNQKTKAGETILADLKD